ncbi:hypothetical protein MKD49_08795 [Herbaspirillum sp. WGmk3]|jgi:hypothetical protein|uniref:hypothetical protein n=1 Tax=Herbaspirillum sp. WGmk3 TaxID=2919925 RepID=UPI002091435B|nr:hypothetical protein [Herbaspirillum sp. WGmk3]MCO4856577.1 hypothetical protein [Herbaspirillum sp. WGmk3]
MKRTALLIMATVLGIATALLLASATKVEQSFPPLEVQGTTYQNACTAPERSELRRELPHEAHELIETLLCASKTPARKAYLKQHVTPNVNAEYSGSGQEDIQEVLQVDDELLDHLMKAGEAWQVTTTVTDEQIEVMFFADEACVESRSLRLDQGKWLLYGLGAGCD